MGVEIWLKCKAKKTISKEFRDTLLEFNEKDISISLEQKKDIKQIKKDTTDTKSNLFKTILKGGGLALIFLLKTFRIILRFSGVTLGTVVGMIINGFTMNQDIKALFEFYGKRLKYRYFENLSINYALDYFRSELIEYDEI